MTVLRPPNPFTSGRVSVQNYKPAVPDDGVSEEVEPLPTPGEVPHAQPQCQLEREADGAERVEAGGQGQQDATPVLHGYKH